MVKGILSGKTGASRTRLERAGLESDHAVESGAILVGDPELPSRTERGVSMTEPINWDGLFAEYTSARSAALSGLEPLKPFKLPKEAVRRATSPTRDDLS